MMTARQPREIYDDELMTLEIMFFPLLNLVDFLKRHDHDLQARGLSGYCSLHHTRATDY